LTFEGVQKVKTPGEKLRLERSPKNVVKDNSAVFEGKDRK
jgi:hypothetical protein